MTSPDTTRTAYGNEMEDEIGWAFARYLSAKDSGAVSYGLVRAAVEPVIADLIAARAERDSLRIRLQEAERVLKPFAALSFSYDGFSCDPAALVFNGREHGSFWPNEHAAFEAMIKAAKLALLTQEESRDA